MHIGITGAPCFLGRYLVRELAAAGHDCRCWHRPDSDRSGMSAEALTWIPGALGDERACRQLVEACDAVVHSALDRPGPRFQGAEGDLVEFAQKNIVGSLQLMQAAREAGVGRFIFISTCAVHDRILDDRPLDETHPLWPRSHYGAHKAALEAFVHSYGLGTGWDVCAVRPCGIYGLACPAHRSKWYDLVAAVVRGESLECRGGGKEVHAADVARAVALLLTAEGVAGEAYNCCDRYTSRFEVASIARELAGSQSKIGGGPSQPKHQIATDKLEALGMQFGGEALLRRTVAELIDSVKAAG